MGNFNLLKILFNLFVNIVICLKILGRIKNIICVKLLKVCFL